MSEPEPKRQLADQAALRADQGHPDIVHDPDITPRDPCTSTLIKSTGAPNNTPSDAGIDYDCDPMDLATRIRRARHLAKLSQQEVAKVLQVRQSAVSQWERGIVEPEIATRIRLAALLNMPLVDVLPDAGALPEAALSDPDIRLTVSCLARLSPKARRAVQVLVLALEERERRHK